MKIALCTALVAGGFATMAMADTIQLSYKYVEAGGSLSGVLNGTDYTNGANADGMQFMETANAVGPLASQIGSGVWAACRELGQFTDFPFNTYQVGLLENSSIGTPKANLIRQLWAKHYDYSAQTNTPIFYGGSFGGFVGGQPADNAENRASLAFIYAIYAIRYNFDGTAGSLTVSNNTLAFYQYADSNPASIALSNSWLSGLDLNYTGPLPTLLDLTSDTLQDLVIEVPAPGATGLLAVAGLSAFRRRR